TMTANAEAGTGPVWAAAGDPRRTRIGKFLRRFSLDELPQLWNVLVGEMSLVGPRPERPQFVSEFKARVPRYEDRHLVRPGLTGWAQVNDLRGQTSVEERLIYDLYYIENWSLAFDLKIILITLVAVSPDHTKALGLYRAYLIEPIAFFFVLGNVLGSIQRARMVLLGLAAGGVVAGLANGFVVLDAIRHHTLNLALPPPVVIYNTSNATALYLVPLI